MNKADKLIQPDIERCPGCGIDTNAGLEIGAIEPDCRHQQFDTDGNLLDFVLYWECNRCGCNWKHGQFQDQEEKASHMDCLQCGKYVVPVAVGICKRCIAKGYTATRIPDKA